MKLIWQDKYQTISHEYDEEDFDVYRAFELWDTMLKAVGYHSNSVEDAVLEWAHDIERRDRAHETGKDPPGWGENSEEVDVQATDGSCPVYIQRCYNCGAKLSCKECQEVAPKVQTVAHECTCRSCGNPLGEEGSKWYEHYDSKGQFLGRTKVG